MFKELLNLIYPRRCPLCHGIVTPKGKAIHEDCLLKLSKIGSPKCYRCGKPVEMEEIEYCHDCSKKNFHYVRGFPLWIYNKELKQSIIQFKFKGKKEYNDFYVAEYLKEYKEQIQKLKADAFIPIPLHGAKLRKRGFNQAEIFADGIAREIQIPVIKDVLVRTKKTLPQKELDDKERILNLQRAFILSENQKVKLMGLSKVILVDDIYTTGSTIEACTRVLLEAGVKEVYFITLCIGRGY